MKVFLINLAEMSSLGFLPVFIQFDEKLTNETDNSRLVWENTENLQSITIEEYRREWELPLSPFIVNLDREQFSEQCGLSEEQM